METRTERYTRYRERIKTMSEMEFPRTKEGKESFSHLEAELASASIATSQESSLANSSPYHFYLHRKRVSLVIKVVLALAIIAGLAVWFYFLQGRAGS